MVEVVYRGGNMDGITSNAASEATLLKLLAAFGKGGGDSSKLKSLADRAEASKMREAKKHTDATKKDTEATDEHSAAVGFAIGALKTMTKTLTATVSAVFSGIGNVVETVANLGMELLAGGNRLSDFSSHLTGLIDKIPLIGGILSTPLQMIVGVLDKNIDIYRQMTATGIRLGEGLFGVVKAAADAGLSVDTMAGILSEKSTTLALAFGTTSEGARRFTGILKEIRDQGLDKQFYNLGLTLAEYSEYTADYIELERLQGRHKRRTDAQLAAGTALYIGQLDRLAKITGMQRKEAQAALEKQALDKNWRSYLATLPTKMRDSMTETMAVLDKASPEVAEAIKGMIMTGAPIGDVAKGLAAMHPELQPLIDEFKRTGDVQSFLQGVQDSAVKAGELDKALGQTRATISLMGSDMATGSQEITKLNSIATDYGESMKKEKDHFDKLKASNADAMLAFDGAIENTRTMIMSKLIDSKLFEKVAEQLGRLTAWVQSPDGMAAIERVTSWFVTKMNNIVDDFHDLSISQMFDKWVWQPLKRAIVGDSPEDRKKEFEKRRDEDLQRIQNMWSELTLEEQKSAENIKAFDEMRSTVQTKFANDIASVDKAVKEGDEGNKGLLGHMFSGILQYLPSMETLGIGLGLVTAAVLAMGAAGVVASPGLLLIGAAFLSIGAAGAGIGYMVEQIALAITSLREDMELFTQMDSDKLSEIGESMTPLTDNLLALAGAGFIANFIADDSFKKLADGIKEFNGIDHANLSKIGPAMASLQRGMAAFVGDGVMESVGKVLTSWISSGGNQDSQMKAMADNLKVFGDIDATGLVAVGGAMEGIANFIETLDDSNIKNVAEAVDQLTEAMVNYGKEGNKLTADMQGSFTTAVTAIGGTSKGQSEQLVMVNNKLQSIQELLLQGNKVRVSTRDAVEEGIG